MFTVTMYFVSNRLVIQLIGIVQSQVQPTSAHRKHFKVVICLKLELNLKGKSNSRQKKPKISSN